MRAHTQFLALAFLPLVAACDIPTAPGLPEPCPAAPSKSTSARFRFVASNEMLVPAELRIMASATLLSPSSSRNEIEVILPVTDAYARYDAQNCVAGWIYRASVTNIVARVWPDGPLSAPCPASTVTNVIGSVRIYPGYDGKPRCDASSI